MMELKLNLKRWNEERRSVEAKIAELKGKVRQSGHTLNGDEAYEIQKLVNRATALYAIRVGDRKLIHNKTYVQHRNWNVFPRLLEDPREWNLERQHAMVEAIDAQGRPETRLKHLITKEDVLACAALTPNERGLKVHPVGLWDLIEFPAKEV